ncbi:hypothetical protein B5G12_05095 [Faecalibacterium sp. An58]|uniref:hypothetical protein n=1 Tax=Faecalibacterium sp. An58 TaxID=1965648 RepID=UPI000B39F2AF|nr:hypothetical protein [Faecalibacterium sp. An58]OUN74517.1 hypothetical protein B5G12_05095 [Faecalibacterium sp. An58]
MKLNKVMALALSGLMAVSMLAGCAGDPSNGDGGNTEVTPPASNAVSVMNDAQSVVKFGADNDFESAVVAAAKDAKYTDVNSANYTASGVSNSDKVFASLEDKLPVADGMYASNSAIMSFKAAAPGTVTTKTTIYKVKNEGLTEEAALKQVATKMDMDDTYPTVVSQWNASTSKSDYYEVSYTGSVSIVTVNTADEGKTASAYYIAVQVTQNVARDAIVIG